MNKRTAFFVTVGILIAALLAKFFFPLLVFDVPLGYDPGIYRYLIAKYAQALSTFSLPELAPWAQEYPKAYYIGAASLALLGVPVDAILGWMWNIVPVLLACALALVTYKRSDAQTGAAVLLIALLSQPYYDGFYAMYIKVYVSLFFVIATFFLAERMSFWFPFTALIAVLLHQQTGLLLTVALACWWAAQFPQRFREKRYRNITAVLVAVGVAGVLFYLPQWERAIWSPLKSIILLRGEHAPSGAFPDASFYIQTMSIVLLLGIGGFLLSFKKERGSLWQFAVIVPLIFVVLRLVFYKRFFLLMDFFLMPYAAAMLVLLWRKLSGSPALRGVLVVVVTAQLLIGMQVMQIRRPVIRASDITLITQAADALPDGASIIALENISGTWLRGWVPVHVPVGAPGLFDFPSWAYEDWEQFVDGTNAQRRSLLSGLSGDVYFFVSPTFTRFYGERAKNILSDPCLKPVEGKPLMRSACSS